MCLEFDNCDNCNDCVKCTKCNNCKCDKNILRLLKNEYVIFLSNSFYGFFKRRLLKYFDKYNILYLNYNNKQYICNKLNNINQFIKSNSEDDKKKFMNKMEISKLKLIYFLENNIEPNILYKKISFSKEELFMSFDNYVMKKMEYKFRTFCQIAEKLGAEKITIKSKIKNYEESIVSGGVDINGVKIDTKLVNNDIFDAKIDLKFVYTNYAHNLLLNKFYINELIEEENEFFISKEDFNSDIDLKFLIDTRCLNLIQKYDTDIIIKNITNVELKICAKALDYGLNIGLKNKTENSTCVNIAIEFIDIYKNPENILVQNLYSLYEGFLHLTNIIKLQINNIQKDNIYTIEKEKIIYGKINNFLKTHLICLNNGHYMIEYKNNVINFKNNKTYDVLLSYENIISKNFTNDEINNLFFEFFKNNLSHTNFRKFRDILIFGRDNIEYYIYKDNPDIINKFYFNVIQYNKIKYNNDIILSLIKKYLDVAYSKIIHNIIYNEQFITLINWKKSIKELYNIFDNFKDDYENIILSAYSDSYLLEYGINDVNDIDEIVEMVINSINYDFENKFMNLMVALDSKILYNNSNLEDNEINKYFNNLTSQRTTANNSENNSDDEDNQDNRDNNQDNKILCDNVDFDIELKLYNDENVMISNFIQPDNCELEDNMIKEPKTPLLAGSIRKRVNAKKETSEIINIVNTILIKKTTFELDYNKHLRNLLFVKKNIYNIIMKYEYNSSDVKLEDCYKYIDDIISIEQAKTNYQEHNIFYTWENFKDIVKQYKKEHMNRKSPSRRKLPSYNEEFVG